MSSPHGGGKHWQTWQSFSVTRQFSPKRQPLARLPPGQKGTLTAAVVALFVLGGSPVVLGSPAKMRGEQALSSALAASRMRGTRVRVTRCSMEHARSGRQRPAGLSARCSSGWQACERGDRGLPRWNGQRFIV